MPKYDAIQIGDKVHLKKVITREDIEIFGKLTGDHNPLHFHDEFAKKQNLESPVVHGMLTASFLSTLVGMKIPGEGAVLANLKIDFRKPVFVGDTITVTIEVTKKIFLSKNIFLNAEITNQYGQVVAKSNLRAICPE